LTDELSVTIRHAEPDDYDRVITSVDAWWGGRQMAGMLPRLFFTYFRPWSYIAAYDEAIVGFLAGFRSQTDPCQVYCHFVGVDPGRRGRGVGEALYQRLFVAAASQGCHEVLAVTAPTNRGSIAFHTRMGFALLPGPCVGSEVPFTPAYDGPGEDRVRFRRPLDDPAIHLPTFAD
jgi:L-amino acid N-acyltransferase YncA